MLLSGKRRFFETKDSEGPLDRRAVLDLTCEYRRITRQSYARKPGSGFGVARDSQKGPGALSPDETAPSPINVTRGIFARRRTTRTAMGQAHHKWQGLFLLCPCQLVFRQVHDLQCDKGL